MNEKGILKTPFVTQDGHYEFTRMPFGLVNSDTTLGLVKGIRKLLRGIYNVGTYRPIDHIIYMETWQEHVLLVTPGTELLQSPFKIKFSMGSLLWLYCRSLPTLWRLAVADADRIIVARLTKHG